MLINTHWRIAKKLYFEFFCVKAFIVLLVVFFFTAVVLVVDFYIEVSNKPLAGLLIVTIIIEIINKN
jgi:hypothetical protein